MSKGDRYYRQITATVLRWYLELESGVIPGASFDVRVLNYRLDVERVLRRCHPADVTALLAIHRDGLKQAEALRLAGITAERPDAYVALLEIRLGKLLARKQLVDLQQYLT